MGVDKEGLDRQIAEKKVAKEAERQANVDQAAYDQEIFRILESNEEQRRAEKMESMNQLRQDLLAHAQEPKNTCEKGGDPIDAEQCSFGAAQYFAGEDKQAQERKRLQQAQMRQWTTQQMAEKNARSTEEKEDAMRYQQYLNAVNGMRAEIEANEQKRVRYARPNLGYPLLCSTNQFSSFLSFFLLWHAGTTASPCASSTRCARPRRRSCARPSRSSTTS
jgi:hypothetical protein